MIMDANQNKLINLLKEIHDICEKENLLYVLGGVTAKEAGVYGELAPDRYTAVVYMTVKDFMSFKKYVEDNRSEDRIIEGLHNNDRFPGFFFKYVDKTTTYYNYNYGNTYKHNGIQIRIELLRKYYAPKKIKKLVSRERGFAFNSYRYKRKISFKSRLLKWGTGVKLFFARACMAKKLYNDCLKKYTDNRDFVMDYGIYNRKRTKLVKYPSYLLTGRVSASLCGQNFYVPKDLEIHSKIVFGKNVMDKPLEPVNNSTVLISDITPYSEYITDLKERYKTARLRKRIRRDDKLHGAVTYHIRKDWKIMQAVNARLDIINLYKSRKEEIISLYKQGNFDELTNVFEEYDAMVREHYHSAKMTLYFDKDIHDIYLAWLRINSNGKFAGRINRAIPKQWK